MPSNFDGRHNFRGSNQPTAKCNNEIYASLPNTLVYFTNVRYSFNYIWPEEENLS